VGIPRREASWSSPATGEEHGARSDRCILQSGAHDYAGGDFRPRHWHATRNRVAPLQQLERIDVRLPRSVRVHRRPSRNLPPDSEWRSLPYFTRRGGRAGILLRRGGGRYNRGLMAGLIASWPRVVPYPDFRPADHRVSVGQHVIPDPPPSRGMATPRGSSRAVADAMPALMKPSGRGLRIAHERTACHGETPRGRGRTACASRCAGGYRHLFIVPRKRRGGSPSFSCNLPLSCAISLLWRPLPHVPAKDWMFRSRHADRSCGRRVCRSDVREMHSSISGAKTTSSSTNRLVAEGRWHRWLAARESHVHARVWLAGRTDERRFFSMANRITPIGRRDDVVRRAFQKVHQFAKFEGDSLFLHG